MSIPPPPREVHSKGELYPRRPTVVAVVVTGCVSTTVPPEGRGRAGQGRERGGGVHTVWWQWTLYAFRVRHTRSD